MALPIIFSRFVEHERVAILLRAIGTAVAAGFVDIDSHNTTKLDPVEFRCYGESISLNLKSRGKEDSLIVQSDFEFSL